MGEQDFLRASPPTNSPALLRDDDVALLRPAMAFGGGVGQLFGPLHSPNGTKVRSNPGEFVGRPLAFTYHSGIDLWVYGYFAPFREALTWAG